MPGPLGNAYTAAEIRSIFECLQTPYADQYVTMDGLGMIGATTTVNSGSTGQAKSQILAWLTAMDADSITKVQALVVKWDAVRDASVRVNNGGVGDQAVTGVTWDSTDQKKAIQDLMVIYVPFMRYHEVLARRAGGAGVSLTIPMVS